MGSTGFTTQLRRRKAGWLLIGLCLLLVLAGAVVPAVGLLVRGRVKSAIRQQLGMDLVTGSIWYLPPYGIYVRNAKLVTRGPDEGPIDLLTVRGIDLKLAQRPRQGTPLIIERLSFNNPCFHVVRESHGPVVLPPGQEPPKLDKSHKSSEKFQLHHLALHDACVSYEDRVRHAASIELQHIDLTMNERGAGSVYDFEFAVADGPRVHLTSAGSIDVDTAIATVAKLSANVAVASTLIALPLPDGLRARLAEYSPDGKLAISGTARVPLRQPGRTDYDATVDLEDGVARVPRWQSVLERGDALLRVRSRQAPDVVPTDDPPDLDVTIDHVRAVSGPGSILLEGGVFSTLGGFERWNLEKLVGKVNFGSGRPFSPVRPPSDEWFFHKTDYRGPLTFTAAATAPFHLPPDKTLLQAIQHEIVAYARDMSVQPGKFPLPVDHLTGGPISLRGGVVTFQNLTGAYGGDRLLLESTRLVLEDFSNPRRVVRVQDLRQQVRFEQIVGTLVCHQPGPEYPGALAKVFAQLRPSGPFVIGGWYAINRAPPDAPPGAPLKPDYFLHVMGDNGSFAVSDWRIPLDSIQGTADISPMLINIPRFQANSFGGTVNASTRITPGKPTYYEGDAKVRGVDLAQFGALLAQRKAKEVKAGKLSGKGYLDVHVSSRSKDPRREGDDPLKVLTASGEFEVIRGNFWSVEALGKVAGQVNAGRNSDPGESDAAGVFSIADKKITLENAAVNNPALGLQGSGTIGFDKSLDLRLIAAPLGDWRANFKQANIPILSDVAGEIVGAVQKLFNLAQGTLLYQFQVSGTTDKPEVSLVPAPAITEPLALLFGRMVRGEPEDRLIEEVRPRRAAAASPGTGAHGAPSRGTK